MQTHQREFFDFVIACGALRFGEFKLKSGRVSPYFFNAGLFNTGSRIAKLGEFYAQAIRASGIEFDMLFGPAYKGIPLIIATAIALAAGGRDVPYAFNRKEAKDHGEGGVLVGSPLSGKVLIVDDVISAGTSIGESVRIIRAAGAVPTAAAIALDRQERGNGAQSAIQEVETQYRLRVVSIADLDVLLEYLLATANTAEAARHRDAVQAYRDRYGIAIA